MGTKLSDILSLLTDKEKSNSVNIRDNLNKYLYHWPLFFIGLIFSMSCAFVYMQTKNPLYSIKASVIIKDEKKESDEKEKLEEIDLSNSPKLAENEMEVFKSRNLINQVVSDLQLWIVYQQKDGLKTQDLYGKAPIKFRLLDTTEKIDKQIFKIKVKDSVSFFLIKSDGSVRLLHFKDVLKNNFGTWQLQPTLNIKNFLGREIIVALTDPNKVAEKYQKAIDVDMPNKMAPTLELELKDDVEQRGKDILNDLIKRYNKTTLAEKDQITQQTLDFINNRIVSIADELNSNEKEVENYRSNNGITDISSQSKVYLENVQTNDNKLNDVNIQLNIVDGIERYLNSSQNIQSSSAALGQNYPSLNSLIEKLSQLQLKRDQLLSTTPEGNPAFDPINRQIESTKADIRNNIQNIKQSLLTAKAKLQSFNSKFESSIRSIPIQERELVDKTRQQNIKQNLYVYLLQKKEEVGLNYASILPDARVVDYAYSDSAKSSGGLLTYCAALLLGLVIPAGFIYGRNSLNNRITTKKEIEEATGVPVFGELSYVKAKSPVIVFDKDNAILGEEFRALRTNLLFLDNKVDKSLVMLITSSIPNEGKSFISINLATILAVSGKRAIILEMDLRRPKISEMLNLSTLHPGISNYLIDKLPIGQIIQNSKIHDNLDIIGSGPLPSAPSELLGMEEIGFLISQLRSKYDYIIIDTPPINLVTDAKILSHISDTALYIIRQAYTYKSLLPFIKALSTDQQFNNMRIIFNGIQKERYGYGYNYGNEYYQKMAGNKKTFFVSGFNNFLKRF